MLLLVARRPIFISSAKSSLLPYLRMTIASPIHSMESSTKPLKQKKLFQIQSDDDEQVESHKSSVLENKDDSENEELDADSPIKVAKAVITEVPAIGRPNAFGNWKPGDPVPYKSLATTFEELSATTKRLAITSILTTLFSDIMEKSPKDLVQCVYLCLNRVCPDYEGTELGIGPALLLKAVSAATGRGMPQLKEALKETGDLGQVAMESKNNQPSMFAPKSLTVNSVFKTLKEIASFTGNAAQNKKVDKIRFLLVSAKGSEVKFIVRSLEGSLRIGVAGQTVIQALAHASVLRGKNAVKKENLAAEMVRATKLLKTAYSEVPSYDIVIDVLLNHGIDALPSKCKLTVGVPVKPMLAHPTKSIADVLSRFENCDFTCEYKYDGERAQIHRLSDGTLRVFSRNQEEMTTKYPDLIGKLDGVVGKSVDSFIIDAEVVAWDREQKRILPFQTLSTRKRKDVDLSNITVQVCLYGFDLLYLNNESFLTLNLADRRKKFFDNFMEREGDFQFAKYKDCKSVEEIEHFLDDSIAGYCEGLMIKTLDHEATYEPSQRSRNWLKVKKDYLQGIGDSIDLVVVGGYIGKGKRTGWYGGFLLACYDPDAEVYQTICKIGTGFSEEQLSAHATLLKNHEIPSPRSYYSFGEGVKPDVWFDPVQVWEVKAADLSISPIYHAGIGLVDPNKGISLRFPRFIRVREDKKPEDATSCEQIAEMYRQQLIVQKDKSALVDGDW